MDRPPRCKTAALLLVFVSFVPLAMGSPRIAITEHRDSRYLVVVDGDRLQQHQTKSEALEAAVNAAQNNPDADVRVMRGAEWHVRVIADPEHASFFDATRYRRKPSDPLPGTRAISYLGRTQVFGPPDEQGRRRPVPAEQFWNENLPNAHHQTIVVSLEGPDWDTDIRNMTEQQAYELVEDWVRFLLRVRDVRPDAEIGTYAMFPIRSYFAPVRLYRDPLSQTHQATFAEWYSANMFLAETEVEVDGKTHRISDLIDFAAPSLYEFYPRPEEWVQYARGNVQAARLFSDDIRPFIWAQAHPSRRDDLFEGLGYLDEEHWRTIVRFCLENDLRPILWSASSTWHDAAERRHEILLDELESFR